MCAQIYITTEVTTQSPWSEKQPTEFIYIQNSLRHRALWIISQFLWSHNSSLNIITLTLLVKYWHLRTSLVAQTVKNLLAMQVTHVQSLGWEDSLEKEMATLSSILAWRIPWTEEPGRLQSMGSLKVGQDWATNTFLFRALRLPW